MNTPAHSSQFRSALLLIVFLGLSLGCLADKHPRRRQYTSVDTINGLLIYRPMGVPHLALGSAPNAKDTNILFSCEAARTEEASSPFAHADTPGGYEADEKCHADTASRADNGVFVYYNGQYRFIHDSSISTSSELSNAAKRRDGMGFEQTFIIHNYEFIRQRMAPGSKNTGHYRSLCQRNDTLYVVETLEPVTFTQFVWMLADFGARNAICLDISGDKSHSFYRDNHGKTHKLLRKGNTDNTSNWLYFTRSSQPAPKPVFMAEPAPNLQRKRSSASASSSTASSRSSKKVYYTVRAGDTLSKIAAKYKSSSVTPASIKRLNGLRSDLIRPGQRLRIK